MPGKNVEGKGTAFVLQVSDLVAGSSEEDRQL